MWENEDNIVFLRKIIPGSIKKSYGIEVAKLAWLPVGVIEEAHTFLKNFENTHGFSQLSLWNFSQELREKIVYKTAESLIEQELKNIDVDALTPLQALNILSTLKSKL